MAILETTTTAAAATESTKLQRHFGRFDILFFLICTIVGVDTIAPVASSADAGRPQRSGCLDRAAGIVKGVGSVPGGGQGARHSRPPVG
jgi:hypothetical protein